MTELRKAGLHRPLTGARPVDAGAADGYGLGLRRPKTVPRPVGAG